jgi:hypothetical protein
MSSYRLFFCLSVHEGNNLHAELSQLARNEPSSSSAAPIGRLSFGTLAKRTPEELHSEAHCLGQILAFEMPGRRMTKIPAIPSRHIQRLGRSNKLVSSRDRLSVLFVCDCFLESKSLSFWTLTRGVLLAGHGRTDKRIFVTHRPKKGIRCAWSNRDDSIRKRKNRSSI